MNGVYAYQTYFPSQLHSKSVTQKQFQQLTYLYIQFYHMYFYFIIYIYIFRNIKKNVSNIMGENTKLYLKQCILHSKSNLFFIMSHFSYLNKENILFCILLQKPNKLTLMLLDHWVGNSCFYYYYISVVTNQYPMYQIDWIKNRKHWVLGHRTN